MSINAQNALIEISGFIASRMQLSLKCVYAAYIYVYKYEISSEYLCSIPLEQMDQTDNHQVHNTLRLDIRYFIKRLSIRYAKEAPHRLVSKVFAPE